MADGDRPPRDPERLRIGPVGAGVLAEHVSRKLVQHHHQGQAGVRIFLPVVRTHRRAPGRGFRQTAPESGHRTPGAWRTSAPVRCHRTRTGRWSRRVRGHEPGSASRVGPSGHVLVVVVEPVEPDPGHAGAWPRLVAFALQALAQQLAVAAHRFGPFARASFRGFLVAPAKLHFPEHPFPLHFLLQRPKRLVNIVVTDGSHARNSASCSSSCGYHTPAGHGLRWPFWIAQLHAGAQFVDLRALFTGTTRVPSILSWRSGRSSGWGIPYCAGVRPR